MKLTTGLLIGLGVGFFYGVNVQQRAVKKRLDEAMPIVTRIVSDILYKTCDKDLTRDEVRAMAEEELEFLKIALDN